MNNFSLSGNLRYRIGSHSIIGDRASQQDYYGYQHIKTSSNLAAPIYGLALADGVGGEVAGDIASRLATNTFLELMSINYGKCSRKKMLRGAVTTANESIGKSIFDTPIYTGMATTLVGAVISRDKLHWISIGDSHLYLIRNGEISKLNDDHSMGALIDRQYEKGYISEDEWKNAPYRNMILSCLSGHKIEMIDLPKDPMLLQENDRILFASDGLDTLVQSEILEVSVQNTEAQNFAKGLTDLVSSIGKPHQDNTAVLSVDCYSS